MMEDQNKPREEDVVYIDNEQVADWIQDQLLKEGIIAKKEDIVRILELETKYMEAHGLIFEAEVEYEKKDEEDQDAGDCDEV